MQTTQFDVIVVGSGASGGWAAKRLSEAGIKVALLEAGKPQGDADFTEHVPAYDLTYRNRARDWIRRTRPRAEGLLRLPRVELRVVRQRSRGALHHARGQAVQLAGPHARRRRPHQRLGPAELPLQRAGLQGKSYDGYGEDWPLLLQATSRRTTTRRGLRRHLRASRRACPSCPTASSIRRCR